MSNSPTRREILKAGAGAAFGLAAAPAFASPGIRKAGLIKFAVIGVAGRGANNLASAAEAGNIVALCDVDAERLSKSMIDHPRAAGFSDFRQMLDAIGDEVEAVVVSTPDHTHGPAAAMALRMGKHVYCEKPLTRTVHEARVLKDMARKAGVQTQMGNQGTASTELRRAAMLVKDGILGDVTEVHCWTDRPGGWWAQGVERQGGQPEPKTVNWDAWVGPSSFRTFAPGYHPFGWRGWWDFGSGSLGDMGCHVLNLPFMALDLVSPSMVRAETSGSNRDSFPAWSMVEYAFPARGRRKALKLHWYDGGKKPSPDLAKGVEYKGNGTIIVGTKDTMYIEDTYGNGAKLMSGKPMPEREVPVSPGHFTELAEAIRGGRKPMSNFVDYACDLTETVLLGNLAIWDPNKDLAWDARRMQVPGRPDLNALLKPDMRAGWGL
jgi:predicted dehydrogenase